MTVERGLRKIVRTYPGGRRRVSWQVRLVDTAGTVRHHGTFASKAAARRALVDARAAVRDGTYAAPAAGKARFRDVADHWLASRPHLTARSRQSDRLIITGKLTALHDVRVDRLDYDTVVAFQTRLAGEGLAPSTQRRIMSVVRAVCADARRRRLITADPCVDLPAIRRRRRHLRLP